MIDISKCSGDKCSRKEQCYRYRVIGSEHQSYFYPLKSDGTCDAFIQMNDSNSITNLLPISTKSVAKDKK